MPAGLQQGSDAWYAEYEDCKKQADEALNLLQERNTKHSGGGQEASRITALLRRKLGALGSALEALRDLLESPQYATMTEKERNVRRDMISTLKSGREEMLQNLRRSSHAHSRAQLVENRVAGPLQPAQETARTAELDNQGLLQMQRNVIQEQDSEIDELEKAVGSTKHIALTIHEELGLQERLLDELDEDVDVTHSRMRAAQKKLSAVMKQSGNCKTMLISIALMLILMVVIIICFKLIKLFA